MCANPFIRQNKGFEEPKAQKRVLIIIKKTNFAEHKRFHP